jgi:hypothetical protein
MNTKHLLAASLAGGLISTILVNSPYISIINLVICAGFWVGPIVAAWFFRRLNGTLTLSQAVAAGILAGVCHGVFGLMLSPLGLAGAGGLLREVQPIMSAQDWSELQTNLAGVGGMMFNLMGIMVDIVFGFIGGLLGGAIFRTNRITEKLGA